MQVVIYTTPSCHFCHMTKEFFSEHSVQYTEKDVSTDMAARKEMVEKTGQLGVPVITVDGKIIVGFNKGALSGLLGI